MKHFAVFASVLAGGLPATSAIRIPELDYDASVVQQSSSGWLAIAERMVEDTESVSKTLKAGMQGLQSSVAYFTSKPPQYEAAFEAIKGELWGPIENFADDEFKGSTVYKDAKALWEDGFGNVVNATKDAAERYAANGKLSDFEEVGGAAFHFAETAAAQAFPELSLTFHAFTSLTEGVTAGWSAFEKGDTEAALLNLWNGVNTSIADLVGAANGADPVWLTVVSDLDHIAAPLVSNLVQYKKDQIGRLACHRKSEARPSKKGSMCENEVDWEHHEGICYPKPGNGADCGKACGYSNAQCTRFCPSSKSWCCRAGDPDAGDECRHATYVNHSYTTGNPEEYFQCVAPAQPSPGLAQTVAAVDAQHVALAARKTAALTQTTADLQVAKLDRSLSRKGPLCWLLFWRRSCRRPSERSAFGTYPASCDASNGYPNRIDDLCYPDCEEDWSVVLDEDRQTPECQESCQAPMGKEGVFSITPLSWSVCGNSTTDISQANGDIVNLTKHTHTALANSVDSILNLTGVDVKILDATLDVFGVIGGDLEKPPFCTF